MENGVPGVGEHVTPLYLLMLLLSCLFISMDFLIHLLSFVFSDLMFALTLFLTEIKASVVLILYFLLLQHDGQPYCHKPCYAVLFGPKGNR